MNALSLSSVERDARNRTALEMPAPGGEPAPIRLSGISASPSSTYPKYSHLHMGVNAFKLVSAKARVELLVRT
jgi:hypothetical protein